jgi:KUP system potassium uptake protein
LTAGASIGAAWVMEFMSENVAKDPAPASRLNGQAPAYATRSFWILALGSIGVVFGDIGTSPLYALQTALHQFKGACAPRT